MSFPLYPILRDAPAHYQAASDPMVGPGPCVPCYTDHFPSFETLQQYTGSRPFVFAVLPPLPAGKGPTPLSGRGGTKETEDGSYHLTDSGASTSPCGLSPLPRQVRPHSGREEAWQRASQAAWSPFSLSPFVLCPTHSDVLLVRSAPLSAAATLQQYGPLLPTEELRALEAAAQTEGDVPPPDALGDNEEGSRPLPAKAAEGGVVPRYTEVVTLARYEVVGTSYALERYQLLLVPDLRPLPAPTAAAARAPPSTSPDAQAAWQRTTEAELLARLAEDGGAVLTARHLCRSLARGCVQPLEHEAALAQLYLSGAVAAAAPPPSAAMMEKRFYGTSLPLLGCDEAHRQRCWEQLAQLKEDLRPPPPPAAAPPMGTAAVGSGGIDRARRGFVATAATAATTAAPRGKSPAYSSLYSVGSELQGCSTVSSHPTQGPSQSGSTAVPPWTATAGRVAPLRRPPPPTAAPTPRVCDGMDDIPHIKTLNTHQQWQLKAISNLFGKPYGAEARVVTSSDAEHSAGASMQDSAARLQHVDAFLNLPGADGDGSRGARGSGGATAAPFNPFQTHHGGAAAAAASKTYSSHLSETEMGWNAWNALCADRLNRSIIINSIDEVVHYVNCDRKAFYFAAMYLDLFVRETRANPLRFCQEVRAVLTHPYAPQPTAETTPAIARAIFMQVVLVCAMLACKVHQTYPPTIQKIILCLHEEDRFTNHSDFTRLELILSHLLQFNFLREEENALSMLELLLVSCGGAREAAARQEALYTQQMRDLGSKSGYLAEEVAQRLQLYYAQQDRDHAAKAAVGASEEYELFCCIANLLCDLTVRGLVTDSTSRRRGEDGPFQEARALRIPATVMATAILFVAAELTHAVLPPPLAALYEAHLGCDAAAANSSANNSANTSTSSSNSNSSGSTGSTGPSTGPSATATRRRNPTKGVWLLPAAAEGSAAPALEHFVRLLQAKHLSAPAGAGAGAGGMGAHRTASQSPSPPPGEDSLVVAYEEVRKCFHACKSGSNPCDGIVRNRYKKMLSL